MLRQTQTQAQKVRRLYKTIMKLHRGLPQELKLLGDNYARDEFKRHKNCNLDEAKVFMNEWSMYAVNLAEQLGLRGPSTSNVLGSELSNTDLEQFRDEQIKQLYELKLAAEQKSSGTNK